MGLETLKSVGLFVSSWVNPWHVEKRTPLIKNFFLEYKIPLQLNFRQRAETVEDPYVGKIAQIGGYCIDCVGAFFFMTFAFIFNNTVLSLANIIVNIQNARTQKKDLRENQRAYKNTWIPKNPRFYFLSLFTLTTVGIFYCRAKKIEFSSFFSRLSEKWHEFQKGSVASSERASEGSSIK